VSSSAQPNQLCPWLFGVHSPVGRPRPYAARPAVVLGEPVQGHHDRPRGKPRRAALAAATASSTGMSPAAWPYRLSGPDDFGLSRSGSSGQPPLYRSRACELARYSSCSASTSVLTTVHSTLPAVVTICRVRGCRLEMSAK
jgi:hypothetical protein